MTFAPWHLRSQVTALRAKFLRLDLAVSNYIRLIRNPLLPAELPLLALRAFGIRADRLQFVSHSDNILFRVQAGQAAYALRIHLPDKKETPVIEAELAWLKALRSETSILIPEPITGCNGASVQVVFSPSRRQVFQCVMFRWIDGKPLGRNVCPAIMERAGELMASLHRHALDSPLPAQLLRPQIKWPELHRWLQHNKRACTLSPRNQSLCVSAATVLLESLERPSASVDFGLIHRDLHPWNFLICGSEIGAIDFDECLFAPFLCDIAVPLSYLDHRTDYEVLKNGFLKGYCSIRPLPATFEDEIGLYMAARALYIIDWILDELSLRWRPSDFRRLRSTLKTLARRLPQ